RLLSRALRRVDRVPRLAPDRLQPDAAALRHRGAADTPVADHQGRARAVGRTGLFGTERLRSLIQVAATTGWKRAKCLGLTRNCVDFGHGIVRFEPNTTKNLAGRDAG